MTEKIKNNTTVLEIQNLSKSYNSGSSKLQIIDTASITVNKGEIIALIGPSGTGKSTFLYTAGLLDKYDSGNITILDHKTNNMTDNEKTKFRLNNIGFVYQQHNLFADFTAIENIMIPMLVAGIKKNIAKDIAMEKLKLMDLQNWCNHKPSELSGGQQQRVSIARSIANNPKLLLADEPTGNLDPISSENVLNLFLDLVSKNNMTAIVATHNPTLASKMHRQIALVNGKLYDIHNTSDVKELSKSTTGTSILHAFK